MPALALPPLARRLLQGAILAARPRPSGEIWEWAQTHISLSARVSPTPGPLRLYAYQQGEWSPLWAYRRFRHVVLCWAAQTGKTLLLQVSLAYDIAVDPGPGLVVYPTEKVAKRRSKKHLMPFLKDACADYIPPSRHQFGLFEYNLVTCAINIAHAGSVSDLAAEPIARLKRDETAKFPGETREEADAMSLSEQRTKAFGELATIFDCTTPSLKDAPGWREWADSTQCQRYLPCPACGHFQVLYFSELDRKWLEPDAPPRSRGGIKWDQSPGLSRDARLASAYYECEACGARWTDHQKAQAEARGQWRPRQPGARRYACHLPSWYNPRVRLAYIVEQWFRSYRDPAKRHDFVNSECAIPYEVEVAKLDREAIRRHVQPGRRAGTVPAATDSLRLTVDVHRDHLRWRLRAWTATLESYGVAYGSLLPRLTAADGLDLSALDALLLRDWDGRQIDCCLIDSGYQPDDVYQYALRHPGLVWPSKGQGGLSALVKAAWQDVVADPGHGRYLAGQVCLVSYITERWQDRLQAALSVPNGHPGAWYLEEGLEDDYYHELAGKAKQEKRRRGGQTVYEWVELHDDHLRDCEMLQLVSTHALPPAPRQPRRPPPAARGEAPGLTTPDGRPWSILER